MGVWADRWESVRNRTDWLTNDDDMDMGRRTSAGVRVNFRTALGLTTIWRCVDLLSAAVAQAPKDVVVKIGDNSFPEFAKPSWLVSPDPRDPNYTANDYFAQVALSLLFDGNFFTLVLPNVFDPQVLISLDPGLVTVKKGPIYELRDAATGQVTNAFDPLAMLHGTWLRPAGALRGISPLEALRGSLGAAIATEDHAARFFGQGAALSFGVEVPGKMDPVKREDLRSALRQKYAGNGNAHAIGVLTDGAKFVSGLAPTPEQAQMLATRNWSVEDLCRPYGVPPAMAGSTEPGAASFSSTSTYDRWFKERGVLPLAERIEAPHDRLVSVPDGITDPRASAQFKFNLDGIARASLTERATASKEFVQGGILTPNEARKNEDKPPIAGGDQLFMQQQMVPITALGQTKATEPLNTQSASAAEAA